MTAAIPFPELFLDVSSNNGVLNWQKLYDGGVRSAYIRATMGGTGVDTAFKDNFAKARLMGIKVGFYHLLRPEASGKLQAEHILRTVQQYKQDYAVAIDVERVVGAEYPSGYPSKQNYAKVLLELVSTLQASGIEKTVVYTSVGEWNALMAPNSAQDALLAALPLWTANYTTAEQPLVPKPWKTWILWQYTSEGRIPGMGAQDFDLNRMNATEEKPERFWIEIPVDDPYVISQHFGENKTGDPNFYKKWGLPAHEGTDFDGKIGDPIFAAFDGTVKGINIPGSGGVLPNHPYGIQVKLAHHAFDGDYETDYCHLQSVAAGIDVGDKIEQGYLIGYMGNTGNVVKSPGNDGSHLHMMCRKVGATARGEKQQLADGSWAVYPNDIINGEPLMKTE